MKYLSMILAACWLTACSGSSPKYYVLQVNPAETAPLSQASDNSADNFAIRDSRLPDYLQRQYFVYRDDTGALTIDKHRLWAEELDNNFRRVLAKALNQQLNTPIYTYPLNHSVHITKIIDLDFQTVDANYATRTFAFEVNWQLSQLNNKKTKSYYQRFYRNYTLSDNPDELAQLYSQALNELAIHIAQSLQAHK